MMSQGNVCRLCAEICQDCKSLYDESGTANEVQQLIIQYFDENLLHMVTGNNSTAMCMKCWHTISDFNSFQQSIYRTQRILCMKDEEIDIKSEEEFLPEHHNASNNCGLPTDWNILSGEETTLPRCDTETAPIVDTSNTDDSVEHDEPVREFSGGEFGTESNLSELLVGTELVTEYNEATKIKYRLTKSIPQKGHRISVKASDDLIAQWMPVLKCLFCTEKCSTFSLLHRHFQNKHPLLKCQVKCCSRNFSTRCRFEDHLRLHIDSNAFTCTFCGTKKPCRTTLGSHMREHYPVPIDATINPRNDSNTVSPSSAKVTEISTTSIPKNMVEYNSSRKQYIKASDEFIAQMKPTLNCYLCPEKYTTYSLFRHHFSESHPEEKCYIKCCQRNLTTRHSIAEHFRLHSNPDVFKCKLCELSYSRRNNLQSHMRKHHTTSIKENDNSTSKQENKPDKIHKKSDDLLAKWLPSTKCAVCKEAFDTLIQLQCHFMECHPSEEFYVECCQQKLMTRRKIETHVRYHVTPTGFKCDLCCVCYSYERSLQRHKRMVH